MKRPTLSAPAWAVLLIVMGFTVLAACGDGGGATHSWAFA